MAAYVAQQEQAQAYAQEQGYGNEQDASMQVDQPEAAAPVASTSKRAGEEEVAAASTKKVKIGAGAVLFSLLLVSTSSTDHPAPDFKRCAALSLISGRYNNRARAQRPREHDCRRRQLGEQRDRGRPAHSLQRCASQSPL